MSLARNTFVFVASTLSLMIGTQASYSQVNELDNPNFDSTSNYWYSPGDSQLSIVSDGYDGNACRISGRTQVWNGLSQTLLTADGNKLEDGKDYHFSCYVKTVDAPQGELEIEIGQTDDRKRPDQPTDTFYVSIGTALANNQDWTLLQGGFKLETNGTLTSLHFTVKSNSNDTELFDFMVDSVSVTENNWEAAADARIEQHRKRNVNLNLVNTAGVAQKNITVDIAQVGHHFAFGSTLNAAVVDENIPEYAAFFADNFEWGTIEWQSQWKAIEWSRGDRLYGIADASVDFAEKNGINLRGHALAWPDSRFRPEWLDSLEAPEIGSELQRRIFDVTTRYKSRLAHWDVCNESLNYSFFRDALGNSIESDMFKQARTHDPDVKLCMNEFGIIDSQLKAQRYRDRIRYHLGNKADVGGIGLQSHFQESFVSPKAIEIAMSELKGLGPEIWFTEFDVENIDPDERAEALETFYRYAFSVPEAQGIIMWGFWAGTHWRGADASIVDQDWTINKAGEKYFHLINTEWTTNAEGSTDAAGDVGFRGFHGSYLVTTTRASSGTEIKNYHLVSVPPGDGELDAKLVLDANPNSLTIYGTDGDDVFEYDLENPSTVIINNHPVAFSLPPESTIVRFAGLDGTDHVEIRTKKTNSRARVSDRQIDLGDDGNIVRYTDIDTVNLVAQTDGSVALFYDSSSDDTLESYLDASTLTTPKISITAKDFRHVYAYARYGGNDTATLYDSVHADTIYSTTQRASIVYNRRIRSVFDFEQVEAISLSGDDNATVALPEGGTTISVSQSQAAVVSDKATHKLTDVPITWFRGTGNSDTVLLSGTAGNDYLRVTPIYSLYRGPDFRYVFVGVANFESADATKTGGIDRVDFFDTLGKDELRASGDNVTITGPGYSYILKFFDIIVGNSNKGGGDTATLNSPNGSITLNGEWNE